MKKLFSSFVIAMSMYSKVPMPRLDWNEDSMKYVMIFFPFAGVIVGGCVFATLFFGNAYSVSPLLLSCILTVLPIILTGGIHFDGYMDTVDAISSYGDREKRLQILKDPHVGAFGVIYAIVYILLFFGGACGLPMETKAYLAVALCFVLSRTLSGIGACSFVSANKGSLSTFKNASSKKVCVWWLVLLVGALGGLFVNLCGVLGVVVYSVQLVWFVIYKFKSYKIFGGVSGDTAGYFLQIAEVLSILAVAICGVFI